MTASRRIALLLVVSALAVSNLPAQGGSIGLISVPPGSQDSFCTVNSDGAPLVSVPPYPFNVQLGVGHLVNPAFPGSSLQFVLHDHVYAAPNVPDPSRARVRFEFTTPVTVGALAVMQHLNGISKIEGFAGNAANSLTSVGNVFGTQGDVVGQSVFADFFVDTFTFSNPTAGTIFEIVIRKTSLSNGWANFRIFPLDTNGQIIPTAQFGLDTCAAGTTGSTFGQFVFPLLVNGQSGGQAHQVNVPVNQTLQFSMTQPSFNPVPANFIIVGITVAPDPSDAYILPAGVGALCFPTLYTHPTYPGLFVLANTFAPDPLAILPATPAPWSSPFFTLTFPFQFAIQGVIEETPGVLRTTNGVLVSVF